jgi:hypothetical protein
MEVKKEETLLYRSGDIFLTGKIKEFLDKVLIGTYDSGFYVSYWSLLHFLSGVLVAMILNYTNISTQNKYIYGFIIHTIWEFWQMFIGMTKTHKRIYGKDGLIDTIVDTLFFMFGMFIHQYFSTK